MELEARRREARPMSAAWILTEEQAVFIDERLFRPTDGGHYIEMGRGARSQIITGVADASFPISSSICMIFLIRAFQSVSGPGEWNAELRLPSAKWSESRQDNYH